MKNSKGKVHAEKKKALIEKKKSSKKVEQVTAPEIKPDESDMPTIIAESKAALAAEAAKPIKKRGRPLGSVKKVQDDAPPVTETAKENAEQTLSAPAFSFAPLISETLVSVYAMRAKKTGFKDFAIEREQADGLATQADLCMAKYFPQMGENMGLLSVTILSWGMVLGGRELAYIRFLNEQRTEEEVKVDTEKTDRDLRENAPHIHSQSFFGNAPNDLL